MMLLNRLNFFQPPQFNVASSGILGTTQKVAIDRTWPLEEIVIIVNATVNGTGLSRLGGAAGPQTTVQTDGLFSLVKRVNLSVNDPIAGKPRTVVDFTGRGLVEYAALTGLNIDSATLDALRDQNVLDAQTTTAVVTPTAKVYRIAYRIPLVHPLIADPLRTRMLLPVHLYQQDPILTVDFGSNATGTEIAAGAATLFTNVTAELVLIRRNITASLDAQIQKAGGYIESDLLETPFAIGTGISGEQRIPLNLPGYYLNVLMRQYYGGNATLGTFMQRQVLDQSGTGTTLAGASTGGNGSESRWRLETGGQVIREWRWKHLKIINDWSRPLNGPASNFASLSTVFPFVSSGQGAYAGIPAAGVGTVVLPSADPGGMMQVNTSFNPACSAILDFLTDGLDSANELGSVLDCYSPASRGLKMEVIGPVQSATTNASTIYVGGHRVTTPDISQWQVVR